MKQLRRILIALAAGAATVAISACSVSGNETTADSLGPGYVKVADLYYQVQISRELNPFSDEDSGYLDGLTKRQLALAPGQIWFGVFIQAYNTSPHPQQAARTYYVTDTLGQRFAPIVNPDPNAYSYAPVLIPPKGQLPSKTSDAYAGWTQGEVILFKFPYTTYSARPLTLHIVNPHNPAEQSRIELDV
ncbi:MAG TPA: hypothetical protein VL977_03605 [Solirubrobacteraceae bacterium]|nr:hypothetical protein [Solirubrobacteraceae bacterium]